MGEIVDFGKSNLKLIYLIDANELKSTLPL